MSVFEYDGYREDLDTGVSVKSKLADGFIELTLWSPDGDHFTVTLDPDQAFRVALNLLRGVSLARYGATPCTMRPSG